VGLVRLAKSAAAPVRSGALREAIDLAHETSWNILSAGAFIELVEQLDEPLQRSAFAASREAPQILARLAPRLPASIQQEASRLGNIWKMRKIGRDSWSRWRPCFPRLYRKRFWIR
jgi:hypothetical protein